MPSWAVAAELRAQHWRLGRHLFGKLDPSKPLPTSAATSLAMNIFMCRRLLLGLYQVKIETNAEADRKEHERQP
ncbi:hypothetical protein Ctob_016255 [Chrysochromulina tobinii]|uniref:Uncharacterized protein n=1 Tax=Chrysochromulina tobinii TaxID=1460289 RepID=A0A0M0JZW1_9EUKA|nr:hypothetical protein Ctob_016255 [Chrysochromulina tobinii]|eukprot:KOO31872.1 hypothetical protein Ctob_016255 [Chrysochromulina sp. CCMP291]